MSDLYIAAALSADGVSGEYRPAPLAEGASRISGAGLAGLDIARHLDRPEQVAGVQSGELASVHSWELVTAVDGPGTRMTVFLSGCPLRCLYCHNPDTLEMRRGQMVPTAELIGRMERYRRIFARTGGGLTVSGGEPMMQPRVVARLLEAAKEQGIHTAMDTSGNLGWRCTDDMLGNLDLCLLDIKSGSEDVYGRVTGGFSLQPTIEFGQRLATAGVEVWVRFVLVPGLTDATDNVARVADLAAGIPTVSRVEVLPFHQMGRTKWEELGMQYQLSGVQPPSAEEVLDAQSIFRSRGLTV